MLKSTYLESKIHRRSIFLEAENKYFNHELFSYDLLDKYIKEVEY